MNNNGLLGSTLFYSVHFEAYCSIKGSLTIPCEIGMKEEREEREERSFELRNCNINILAISEFTLENGEISHFHHLIYPGEIPSDKITTVKYTIQNIHGLGMGFV